MSEEIALYRNSKGYPVTHGSYSARENFRKCPKYFELNRVDGWTKKEERASTHFGKGIEAAIQVYEESGRADGKGIKHFIDFWVGVHICFPNITFTECEGDWESLLRAGTEMMELYAIRAPELPIMNPRFQVKLTKTIFPGTEFEVLSNVAYLDILSYPPWNHPALPSGVASRDPIRPLVIDVKTAGGDLSTDLIALDPQLAEYAWQSRYPDVAFLWFVKRKHKLEKGDRVTMLHPVGIAAAGTEWLVLGTHKEKDAKEISRLWIGDARTLQELRDATKGLNANSNAYKDTARSFFSGSSRVTSCKPTDVTKQRLQFAAVRLTEERINNVGKAVGRITAEMLRAHKEGFYEATGGVRFPNNKCVFCEMRGICADKPELRDALLTRAGEEWLEGKDED